MVLKTAIDILKRAISAEDWEMVEEAIQILNEILDYGEIDEDWD